VCVCVRVGGEGVCVCVRVGGRVCVCMLASAPAFMLWGSKDNKKEIRQ
jgi:hypothetical protein